MSLEEKLKREPEEVKPLSEKVVQLPGSMAFSDDEPNNIEDLIASFTEPDDGWKVSVYRLAEPGRLDSASRREFCATLPVTEDLLESIRDKFGGGDYSLEFKKRGGSRRRATSQAQVF